MEPGDTVRLLAYGGEIIERRLVRVDGDRLVVTTDDEWWRAQEEHRAPVVIAFWRGYLRE